MKTFILLLLVTYNLSAQNYDQHYNKVDVYNGNNVNAHDFLFSYDVVSGHSTCLNNITILSNVPVVTSFKYNVYVGVTLAYVGNVYLQPFGSCYINNAFNYCGSNIENIVVKCL